jgi:hypothetical protein
VEVVASDGRDGPHEGVQLTRDCATVHLVESEAETSVEGQHVPSGPDVARVVFVGLQVVTATWARIEARCGDTECEMGERVQYRIRGLAGSWREAGVARPGRCGRSDQVVRHVLLL